jgi:hypothetical protein
MGQVSCICNFQCGAIGMKNPDNQSPTNGKEKTKFPEPPPKEIPSAPEGTTSKFPLFTA